MQRKTKSDYFDDMPLTMAQTVVEAEPAKTGLLDSRGNPLVRQPRPIGFKLEPR